MGFPSLIGRNKKKIFNYISQRVWQKVKGWNANFLSRGDKEILIKTVAQSLPNYVMNNFLLPVSLFDELELLVRQSLRLISVTKSMMSRLLKAKYYPHTSFLEAKMGSNQSYIWRNLMETQDVMIRGARTRIKDGKNTRIWDDPWLCDATNGFLADPKPPKFSDACVNNLMEINDRSWDVGLIYDVFSPQNAARIIWFL
ncbi:uncharacterized protein LOC126657077 [Mercurialis annua]|uniref:uncharacterized protein LOC126657077 n=1 Tax=Mercurialis annua TaxID=3986 RepID=UPI002160D77D|nr:uncharacterized protein LOC126657077 [Mercurialis annua]